MIHEENRLFCDKVQLLKVQLLEVQLDEINRARGVPPDAGSR